MTCKNCGQGIHLHWTGGWVHDERTPSGNYLYCGFRAEPELGGGREMSSRNVCLEPSRVLGPCPYVVPFPTGPTADSPGRVGQQAALEPHVHGLALHAEAFSDLLDPYGFGHMTSVEKVLTDSKGCGYNHYMTTNQKLTAAQERYLAEIREAGEKRYNGRAYRLIKRLKELGLVEYDLTYTPSNSAAVITVWPKGEQ